jgi:hypothetical protein
MISKANKDSKIKSKTHSQDSIPSFIRKTYDILEERKFPEVIDWNPEGTALVIKKPAEFCQKVLPAYFKHNNLTSFVRQLNMYNFHKRRTQNIDHVYYHELFQKGKKHLLKEIKRKNHDHTNDKGQKLPETLESGQNGREISSIVYENQFFKRLYNDAMTKINMLEGQVKDLTMQNQSLWTQLCQHSERDNAMKPMMAKFGKQTSELTQDQLPMTCGDLSIPPLKLAMERQASFAVKHQGNVNHYFDMGEGSGDSTEVSHNSPSLQPSMESEKCFDLSDSTTPSYIEAPAQPFQVTQYPTITLTTPQVYQIQFPKPTNELAISKQEVSVGQMFESWTYEPQNNDMLCFTDQKGERQTILPQSAYPDTGSVLGKRPLDIENQGNAMKFDVPEPLMKRPHELSIFNRRGMISTGTDDKEILRTALRRDSSAILEEYDSNVAVDLMDFTQSFYGWNKAT